MVARTSSGGNGMCVVSSLGGRAVSGRAGSGFGGLEGTPAGGKLLERLGPAGEALDLGRLQWLEILVDAEEVGDLVTEVLGDVVNVLCAVPLRVVLEHG